MKYNRFKNKTVIVTGGAKGIGKATAIAFAEEGAIVGIADCDTELGEMTVSEMKEKGAEALFIKVDVSKREECHKMVETIVRNYKKLDCIVNAAGVQRYVPAEKITEDDWDFVLNINLRGLFWCCQAAGIQMLKQKYGSIVNISSVAAYRTRSLRSAYASSKAGVSALTGALAVEWSRYNIRVNAIAPSLIKTPMAIGVLKTRKGMEEELAAVTAIRRIGDPEEVADLILYLSSDNASYITGQTTLIDGGMSAYDGLE